jgi:hypothetical protein
MREASLGPRTTTAEEEPMKAIVRDRYGSPDILELSGGSRIVRSLLVNGVAARRRRMSP